MNIKKIINNFNKKKIKYLFKKIKYHKIFTLISFILILVISIIIWTITSITKIIVIGGSTSISQVMTNITEQYRRDKKENILYNSLGSAAALVGVKSKRYDFGFLSKDVNYIPKKNDNNFNIQYLWLNYNIICFVFARDYIILFYHLPNNCEINSQQISLQFKNFFGGKGTELIRKIYTNPNFTWKEAFGSQLFCKENNKFYTITREYGSGTKDFFESIIIDSKKNITNQVVPSNGSMFQAISSTPGSIGYISFSYIKRIINDKNLGIKSIASVSKNLYTQPELPYKIINNNYEFNPHYSLTRPFTGIINYKGKKFNNSLSFINWMLDPLPYLKTKLRLLNGKNNFYYDKNFKLNKRHAAYWYIKEGIEPLLFNDFLFKKYNNNTFFMKKLNDINHRELYLKFKKNYKSIWDIIIEKFNKKI